SIIAVAILIGVSFTSVVGYSGVKSNVKASPLFTVRTKRAIDEETEGLTCDYVGKGNILPFPTRDDRTMLIQKVINRISKLNDREFNLFKNVVIHNSLQENKIKCKDVDEFSIILRQLRDNTIDYNFVEEIKDSHTIDCFTKVYPEATCESNFKCAMFQLFLFVVFLFMGLMAFITWPRYGLTILPACISRPTILPECSHLI
ncbi:MAG: hypothetical protein JSW60_00685, partial [Thermoplasmatales archaeon]